MHSVVLGCGHESDRNSCVMKLKTKARERDVMSLVLSLNLSFGKLAKLLAAAPPEFWGVVSKAIQPSDTLVEYTGTFIL